jgi:hypothetical protein
MKNDSVKYPAVFANGEWYINDYTYTRL